MADLAEQLVPYMVAAGLVQDPPDAQERARLLAATPLIQERLNVLSEAPDKLRFLFVADDAIEIEEKARLKPEEVPLLAAARTALADVADWDHAEIEQALRTTLIDGLGLKPKHAFGPVRTAITGSKVSPPLFESMEILGRESSLRRIDRALASVG